ncbi:bifunctional DNA primase/polymerase [Brevundimonas sp.]|uniref:bifunctional DNA primase/polymerase n=1 Tax=Brevundimonas sp. TaxID=1871086 RepID=UPI003BACAAB7
MSALSPFASAAPDLQALGFNVLPALPAAMTRAGRGKAPGRYIGGGWQGLPDWSKAVDEPLSGFLLNMAMKAPDGNIGAVLGSSAGQGADGDDLVLVALDFDATGDALDTLLRAAPSSPMAKRAAKGETRFYLAPKGFASRSYDGPDGRLLDVLARGRFCILPPSIHPGTMAPYVFTRGPVPIADLPVLTVEDMEALEEALEQCGWTRGGRSSGGAGGEERAPLGPYDPSDPWSVAKAVALSRIGDWFPALNLPGTCPARGGWEAVPVWRPSGTGKTNAGDRKRNLSVCPAGIRDWGADPSEGGLTAIDVVERALDITPSEALSWLEDQLGITDDFGSDVIIDLSSRRPVDDESDLPAPLRNLPERAAPKETPPANPAKDQTEGASEPGSGANTMPDVANAPTHKDISVEMPAHLLQVPGLVGEIIDYVTASARKPQRVLALATALTVVGTCGGRRYAGPTGSGTHLYALACAKSGAGKDHGLDMAARLLSAADMTRHIGKGEWMSFQAVYRGLSQQPLTLNPIDELGGFLRRINKRTSGGNEQAITAVLRTAWGKSFKMLPPPGWAGQDMEPIWSPALSILGASTHDDFFKAIEAGDTDNGFLNRWLLFSTQERPAVHKPSADLFEVPASITAGMLAIYGSGDPLSKATMHFGRCDRPDTVAQWEDGEDGALNREYLAWAEELDESSDAESFFARAAEQAIRLATIRAMGCDPTRPVIDRECFAWAKEVSMWCANRMLLDAREFMSENQTQSDRAKVVRAIRSNSPISHRDLLRKLTTFKTRELEEIVKGLEAAELIRMDPGPVAANNKRPKIYTWLGDR